MEIEEVKRRVAEIASCSGDPEAAHSMEDDLHRDVLRVIADRSCKDPAAFAKAALATLALDFPRWCA